MPPKKQTTYGKLTAMFSRAGNALRARPRPSSSNSLSHMERNYNRHHGRGGLAPSSAINPVIAPDEPSPYHEHHPVGFGDDLTPRDFRMAGGQGEGDYDAVRHNSGIGDNPDFIHLLTTANAPTYPTANTPAPTYAPTIATIPRSRSPSPERTIPTQRQPEDTIPFPRRNFPNPNALPPPPRNNR